jgi:tetratricopeptide (TPR) repeat protein
MNERAVGRKKLKYFTLNQVNTMYKIITLLFLIILFASPIFAQKENPLIRQGNKQYEEGKYKEAEIDYRKAIEQKPGSVKGSYNLGNSLYRQENYDEAIRSFSDAGSLMKDANATTKAANLHNLGNSLLKGGKLQESIEAYKQSLRLNPKDEDTRYNLAYAMKQLQQQQQQQQQNQDKKDDQKDKNDQKDQQDQQNNPSQDKDEQKDKPKEKPQISKQDAERMLQALKNDEQKTLEKVNQQKVKGTAVQIEKDW